MLVSEFIEWLKTQDQTATVECLQHTTGSGYYDQGGWTNVVDFDPLSGKVSTYVEYDGTRAVTLQPDCFEYSPAFTGTAGTHYPSTLTIGCKDT